MIDLNSIYLPITISLLSLIFVYYLVVKLLKQDMGTEKMKEIHLAIKSE